MYKDKQSLLAGYPSINASMNISIIKNIKVVKNNLCWTNVFVRGNVDEFKIEERFISGNVRTFPETKRAE